MDNSFIIYLGRHTLETALLLSAPILGTCMIVGITVTLLQAVTSIRDMTLTTVPKLLAVGAVHLGLDAQAVSQHAPGKAVERAEDVEQKLGRLALWQRVGPVALPQKVGDAEHMES